MPERRWPGWRTGSGCCCDEQGELEAALCGSSSAAWPSGASWATGTSRHGELSNLGITHRRLADLDTARSLLEDSVAIAREIGSDVRLAAALTNLGRAGKRSGQPRPRRRLLQESLALRPQAAVTSWGVAMNQQGLAEVSLRAGRARGGRDLLSAHVRLRGQLRRHRVPGLIPGAVCLHRRGARRAACGRPASPAPPTPSGTRRARRSINPARPCSSGSWPRPGPPSHARRGTPSWPPAARSPRSRRSRS